MKPIKYSAFFLINIALYSILLILFQYGLYYVFTNIKSLYLTVLTAIFGGTIALWVVIFPIIMLSKKIKFFKLNSYDRVGIIILMSFLAIITLAFLVFNWLNLNFESTRAYFMFISLLVVCWTFIYSFFFMNIEE